MNQIIQSQQCGTRAEFYLCLSQAFLTPTAPDALAGMRDALPEDLAEISREAGYPLAAAITRYADAIGQLSDSLELLQKYSGLFLATPRLVHLNTGAYLDGSINGGSVSAMETEYRRHGLARDDRFRDLSDHVAVQLEFVAHLFHRASTCSDSFDNGSNLQREAKEFLFNYVARWLPAWTRDLDAAGAERNFRSNPYAELSRILAIAVSVDAAAPEESASLQRRRKAIIAARRKQATRGLGAEDLAEIARKLEAHGLSTEHLMIAPEERDAVMGLFRKPLPTGHA